MQTLERANKQLQSGIRCPFAPLPNLPAEWFNYHASVPCGGLCDQTQFIDSGENQGPCAQPACTVQQCGMFAKYQLPLPAIPPCMPRQLWAAAGSKVMQVTADTWTYVASITPGSVLSVKAYRTLNGNRVLCTVPNDYYTVETVNYGSITATVVKLGQPLSQYYTLVTQVDQIVSENWSDELYITFQSSVGPNTVDILEYIIENYVQPYTGLTYDPTSFNYVRTKLAPFPSNFPILSRKNVIPVLKEIAFQSRFAIWIEDDVIYLKYLPEAPTAADTITVSDMDAEHGVEVELTPTENIVTKMNVKWHMTYAGGGDYAPNESDTTQYMFLRHNVKRYGLHEREYEWYIYNQPDIILKCATFWLNRLSNAWKRLKFRTYLHKLNLEAFDCVSFKRTWLRRGGGGRCGGGEGRLQLGRQLH